MSAEKVRTINIDVEDLKRGLLSLILTLAEIIRDALKIQALKRVEGGSLTEEECERLGRALADLEGAIEEIKEEQGIKDAVKDIRESLDDLVDKMLKSS